MVAIVPLAEQRHHLARLAGFGLDEHLRRRARIQAGAEAAGERSALQRRRSSQRAVASQEFETVSRHRAHSTYANTLIRRATLETNRALSVVPLQSKTLAAHSVAPRMPHRDDDVCRTPERRRCTGSRRHRLSGPVRGLPIVALGASAGGLESLRQLFAELLPASGMGFVVVQHLAPDQPSLLQSVLEGYTKMPAVTAKAGMRVEADRVHVIPENCELTIHRVSKLRRREAARGGMTPAAAVTALASDEDRQRAIDSGFQIHVPKPVDAARLAAVVGMLADMR